MRKGQRAIFEITTNSEKKVYYSSEQSQSNTTNCGREELTDFREKLKRY